MHVAWTFEVDTANTNMLLEKRGDIIKKKRIQVCFRSKQRNFQQSQLDRESLCSNGLFLILNRSHDAMYVVLGIYKIKKVTHLLITTRRYTEKVDQHHNISDTTVLSLYNSVLI